MDDKLRVELEQMRAADQAIREEAMAVVQEHGVASPQYETLRDRGRALTVKHTQRLVEILDKHGWPGLSLVGELASSGAFLALQHADLEVQKRYLPLLREATHAGEAASTSLPLLEDRVLMAEGKKQLYGTQLTRGKDGKPALWPIEDPEEVDRRRESVGLEPLTEYLERFGL